GQASLATALLQALGRGGSGPDAEHKAALQDATRRARDLAAKSAEASQAADGARSAFDNQRVTFLDMPDDQGPVDLVRTDCPLALLPVRLETRFAGGPGSATTLRIRVYPDDIHADSHEPELTP